MAGFWKGRDLVTTRGLKREAIEELFAETQRMRKAMADGKVPHSLEGKTVAVMFFEQSLRSRLFIHTAAAKLGASVLSYSHLTTQDVFRGESFSNAIRLVSASADAIAIRHPMDGAAAVAAEASRVPVVNCGDGKNQHPLTALSYLFEVQAEKKKIDGLKFVFVGALGCSRSVHSLLNLLCAYDVSIELDAAPNSRIPAGLLNELRDSAKVKETTGPDLEGADVVYVTRSTAQPFLPAEKAAALPDKVMLLRQRKSGEKVEEYARDSVALRMALFKEIL